MVFNVYDAKNQTIKFCMYLCLTKSNIHEYGNGFNEPGLRNIIDFSRTSQTIIKLFLQMGFRIKEN